ncbi:MAG: hypothetical protein QNJ73_04590 [Gammaproteobacteria bacterium]|nr:hypothetical protein [Gammaproteobacteria bacterium]
MTASRQCGLTYVEILVATLLLLVGLVPALDALRTATVGSRVNDSYVAAQHRLGGRLEEVLAEPFSELDAAAVAAGSPTTPTDYSEAPGTPGRLLVFIARYDGDDADLDGDPFTGGDSGLLWVQTAIEQTTYSLETLISQ